jgi:uncharacterized repeat protein (TIGR01451 family)
MHLSGLKRAGWLFLFCLLLSLLLAFPWHSQAQINGSSPLTEAVVTLNQIDETGITFQLALPTAKVTDETIAVAGLTSVLHEPGAPALPYYVTWLAVPPEADVAITVNETAVTTSSIGPVRAAPQTAGQSTAELPEWQREAYAQIDIEAIPLLVDEPDMEIYGRSQPYPIQSYYLSEPMYYRDVRLVALHLYPLRYNPVTQELSQAQQLEVQVSFSQANLNNLRPAANEHDTHERMLAAMLLNYETSRAWRSFPANLQAIEPALPLGVQTYKIEIDEDGIYEITGQELADLGMDLNSVNPQTIEMMQRGQPVAYQFIGDNPNAFAPTDRIRFYGWAFDGPRLEQQYINYNVYWLWTGGEPTIIETITNEAGQGYPPVHTFPEEITRAPENVFWATWNDKWDEFPNEPDAWFWEEVRQGDNDILTKTYAITLPHPALTGPDASYIIELMSRERSHIPTKFWYDVRATVNSHSEYGQVTWQKVRNVNLTGTVPINLLSPGVNDVDVVFATDRSASPGNPEYYLNRITIHYERQLTAVGDQLQFNTKGDGQQEYHVAGFSEADSSHALVWDVTNPHIPRQVLLTPDDITGNGLYTYTIGHNSADDRRYMATTPANIQSAAGLSAYTAESINPPAGADWVAISHANFRPAVELLAAHRAEPQFGNLTTHVVDIEDIINQYGYGLPFPQSIKNYLTAALLNWETAPGYVVLTGVGTLNPRNLPCNDNLRCPVSYPWWDETAPHYVPTDLVFKDRFQGLIPSDHTFAALIGEDLLPDLAIGRLATASLTDTYNVVNKIIQHDLNQLTPQAWQHHYLFVADTTDSGGNFCLANQQTGNTLPDSIEQTHLCRPTATPADTKQLRDDMSDTIHDADQGVALLNYRGHGAVTSWANAPLLFEVLPLSPEHPIYDTYVATMNFWQNNQKPLIILSADCLDGNFAWPGRTALSQTFLHLADVGTAAHWSSTGLGYTFEHSVLLQALYRGAFELGLTSLGDAINHSKIEYTLGGYHISEVYSFILQGDPAMQLYRPDLRLEKTTLQPFVEPGDTVQFDLTIHNDGLYAVTPTVVDALPDGLTFTGYETNIATTLTQSGQELTFAINGNLDWGDQFTITINATFDPDATGTLVNTAHVLAPGWDLNPANRQDSAAVIDINSLSFVYLPTITR